MENTRPGLVAVIDVGSNALRMIIAEIKSTGKSVILENVKKSVRIGRDTFASGRISIPTIHDTCEILNNFVKLMKDYRVKYYEAVATSGIREAKNRNYILEQIRVTTGLEVRIINNAEERFFTYKGIREHVTESPVIRQEGVFIIDIGSGGVEISLYHHGSLHFTEYLKVGSLRLWENIGELEHKTLDFPKVMEEYIESRIYLLKRQIQSLGIRNFIGLGGELRNIYHICKGVKPIGKDKDVESVLVIELYSKLMVMTVEQIMKEYHLEYEQARNLLPSVILLNSFLQAVSAETIITPLISLRHGVLADIIDRMYDTVRKADFINDIISSTRYMGKKFGIDEVHSARVEELALTIFDQIEDIHNLGERERLYLQIAAILHDTGKFIDHNFHAIYSGEIVRSQDIIGLSNRELRIISNIVRYHDEEEPQHFHDNYNSLDYQDQIMISKLVACLKLANTLDVSHKQKIENLKIVSQEGKLHFIVDKRDDLVLEKWFFDDRAKFFEEVLGWKPVLLYKG